MAIRLKGYCVEYRGTSEVTSVETDLTGNDLRFVGPDLIEMASMPEMPEAADGDIVVHNGSDFFVVGSIETTGNLKVIAADAVRDGENPDHLILRGNGELHFRDEFGWQIVLSVSDSSVVISNVTSTKS